MLKYYLLYYLLFSQTKTPLQSFPEHVGNGNVYGMTES